jgi:hypothetical protein
VFLGTFPPVPQSCCASTPLRASDTHAFSHKVSFFVSKPDRTWDLTYGREGWQRPATRQGNDPSTPLSRYLKMRIPALRISDRPLF